MKEEDENRNECLEGGGGARGEENIITRKRRTREGVDFFHSRSPKDTYSNTISKQSDSTLSMTSYRRTRLG
jgi:hypothetical protein